MLDTDGSFTIGAALPLTGNNNSGSYFNGSLDEVSLYTGTLSGTTVADHYNLGRGVDSVGPVGGSVDATGLTGTGSRYSTTTNLTLALAKGTDTAGLAATGATLSRGFGTFAPAGGSPSSTRVYRFTYTLQDNNAAQNLNSSATFKWEAQDS